jgi:hypothetical protein
MEQQISENPKEIIEIQQAEITELKKSLQEHFLFFTPDREKLALKAEKERQEKQQLLIKCLSNGLEELRYYLDQGASLSYPNEEGIYPLVAAVYGANLEAVRYIEKTLQKEEAQKQWSMVDVQLALDHRIKIMPSELRKGATYKELGQWYTKEAEKGWWNKWYDDICGEVENTYRWEHNWHGRQAGWKWIKRKEEEINDKNPVAVIAESGGLRLIFPSRTTHDAVIKQIYDQLEELRKEIEIKAGKQPSVTATPKL